MADQNHQISENEKCLMSAKFEELSFGSKAGIGATTLYLAGLGWWMYEKWDKFSAMEPNSWGDYLAGTFGPLAFLWLVLGYFQQGHELRQNSEALKLQAEELKNSVAQQSIIASATQTELEMLMFNMKANIQVRNKPRNSVIANRNLHTATVCFQNFGHDCYQLMFMAYVVEDEDLDQPKTVSRTYVHDRLQKYGVWEVHIAQQIPDGFVTHQAKLQYVDGNGKTVEIILAITVGKDGFTVYRIEPLTPKTTEVTSP